MESLNVLKSIFGKVASLIEIKEADYIVGNMYIKPLG
jgi:hypothetical protein